MGVLTSCVLAPRLALARRRGAHLFGWPQRNKRVGGHLRFLFAAQDFGDATEVQAGLFADVPE